MRVLIAGYGDVGQRLAARLRDAGHDAIGLRRSASADLRADLTVPASLGDLPSGIDAVAYLPSADRRDEAAYRAAYLDGLANLTIALAEQHQAVRRLIFVSSTAVYGQRNGEWVDESSPTEPTSFNGEVLLQAEGFVEQAPFASTIVRFAGIYGPGRTRVIDQVRAGTATYGGADDYSNRIHADDCAGVIAHLLELDQPGGCYVGVDSEPAHRREVLEWLARRLGAPPAARRDPTRPGNKRCRNDLLLASGYRLRYPSYREGYEALIDDPGELP